MYRPRVARSFDTKACLAQSNIGVMHRDGQGVPQNFKEALRWYTKAAEQGNANAQFNLGVLYTNEEGGI